MQQTSETATVGATSNGGDTAPAQLAAMLNVGDVADILRCSARTVYRLADAGRMPRPVKLGALVRWNREAVEAWRHRVRLLEALVPVGDLPVVGVALAGRPLGKLGEGRACHTMAGGARSHLLAHQLLWDHEPCACPLIRR